MLQRVVSDRYALAALVLGGTAIALAPIFVRLSDVGATATGFYRLAFAAPLLWLWMRLVAARGTEPRREATPPRTWALLIAAGIFFAADVMCFHAASRMTSVANATLLLNFAPIFVVIGARLLFGERVRATLAAGLCLALAGAALLTGQSASTSADRLQGDALGLAAAAFYGAYLLIVSRLRPVLTSGAIMMWSSLFGAIALLVPMLAADEPYVSGSPFGWGVLVALALVSQAAGQGLIAFALAYLPVGFSGVVLLLQPVMAALFAWALFGEGMAPLQAVGGVVVLAGVLLASRSRQPAGLGDGGARPR